jgi:predicted dehydrogenase
MSAPQDSPPLRVGVIGLGVGKSHIEGYRASGGAEVVAVADPDAGRLAQGGDAYSIAARFPSGEALIDAKLCDIISVCTPNKFHAELAVRALESGAHVLCEKPLAMNAAEGRTMVAAARAAGQRLMVNFSYRFTPQAQALKARVDAGDLGDAYYARTSWLRRRGLPGFGGWFGDKRLAGGGPLIDLGVHRLDLALWLMGYPEPDWVMGATYDPIAADLAKRLGKTFTVEDLASGFVRFKNGATLSIEAAWAANIKENELMETRVLGAKGGLVHRNIGEDYRFEAEFYAERDGDLWDSAYHEPTAWAAGAKPKSSAMDHFVRAIRSNTPHDATGEQGVVVMELLDAVYASAASGRPVRVGK